MYLYDHPQIPIHVWWWAREFRQNVDGMAGAQEVPEDWGSHAREIGIRLQRRRAQLGLTQEQVADRAGIAAKTYQNFEQGRSGRSMPLNPRLRTLMALSAALETGIDDLVRASAD